MYENTKPKEGETGKWQNLHEEPDSNMGIYLTAAKLVQYRLVADNSREKEEAKQETPNKTATPKLHLQQKRSKDFQKCQDSMNILFTSTKKEFMLINLINLSLTITKDVFAHIVGKLVELPNQIREPVAIEMIRFLLSTA